ncbi:hypothetical protein ATK86_4253 [Nocardia fluminea]|uniref:HNH endonuclease n=1 Tax=Nocardia fluminea TaxID=134984 RepID=A0A2N3VDY9_9NOCA|nr:hypothetical protein ATK86_4253 [Nocardia fluminea]
MAVRRNFVGSLPGSGILCFLCQRSTTLTKAHIPPKCTGNRAGKVVRMRPYIEDGVIRQDSPKDGGLWLKTLCQPCNEIASRYDDAHGDFVREITRIDRLRAAQFKLPRSSGGVPAVPIAPGRVARSVLHGLVALTPSMRLVHEAFLDDLLVDDEVRLPPGLQLRVARVNDVRCRISSAYWMQQVLGRRQYYDVFAEICFYPFIWVLCGMPTPSLGQSLIDYEGWGNATDWARYSISATRSDLRDVLDRLPFTVHPTWRDRNNWMDLMSNDSSLVLEGNIRV